MRAVSLHRAPVSSSCTHTPLSVCSCGACLSRVLCAVLPLPRCTAVALPPFEPVYQRREFGLGETTRRSYSCVVTQLQSTYHSG